MASSSYRENGRNIAVIHYSAPPVIGGVESTIYHHARLLAANGFPVSVITGRGETFHPGVSLHVIPELSSRHPAVLDVAKSLAEGHVHSKFYEIRDQLAESLRTLLAGTDICIIHNATTLHKNMPLTAALRLISDEHLVPLVSWAHDLAWLDPLYTQDLHPGYPWDLLRTSWTGMRYVAVSVNRRKLMSRLFGIPKEQIRVIYPGVDMHDFLKFEPITRSLADELDLMAADPLMLLPSRITRRKNIEFAIRVTAALAGKRPLATLVVTGPAGPHNPGNLKYLEELKSLRETLGVTARVHFLCDGGGREKVINLTDREVSDFFGLADLLLFPSLREGFGIPVLEAGLCRLPVFAANIPPVKESGAHLVHLFDPEGDPCAVAEAIDAHLSGSNPYQLRRRVIDRFTWQAVLEKEVIPLIEEVTNYGETQKS